MPHNFSWIIEERLAGMGQPGCGLELAAQMLPSERRFHTWVLQSSTRRASREQLAKMVGIRASDPLQLDRRMLDLYRKFRDFWGILESYREGVTEDRFVLSTERLAADLRFLEERGIGLIVTLTEQPIEPAALSGSAFQTLHLPVRDREAPTLPQVSRYVNSVRTTLESGGRVVTHCLGGIGRTGTMLASFLVSEGMQAANAIQQIRNLRPGSIETAAQEAVVAAYEDQLR